MLNIVKGYKKEILFGELAFLLHDITKATTDFLKGPENHTLKTSELLDEKLKGYNELSLEYKLKTDSFYYNDSGENKKEQLCETQSILSPARRHHDKNISKYGLLDYIIFAAFGGVDGIESVYGKGVESERRKNNEILDKQQKGKEIIVSPLFVEKNKVVPDDRKIFEKVSKLINKLSDDFSTDKLIKVLSDAKGLELYPETGELSLKEHLDSFLGETRFPLNDTTLYHHSFMTAALGKSLLIKILIEDQMVDNYVLPIRNKQNQSTDEFIKKYQRYSTFKLFMLSVPFGLISKNMHKIPILRGYYLKIQKAFDKLRREVEFELPIGTEVFRDSTSAAYILPDLSMYEETKEIDQNIEEYLKSAFSNILENDLPIRSYSEKFCDKEVSGDLYEKYHNKYPLDIILKKRDDESSFFISTDGDNIVEKKYSENEVKCPQCNIRLMDKDSEYCSICNKTIVFRKDSWSKGNKKEPLVFEEVKDTKNNISCFHLELNIDKFLSGVAFEKDLKISDTFSKTASPSRIAALLEDCQSFFSEIENKILELDSIKNAKRDKELIKLAELPENSIGTEYNKFLTIYKNHNNIKFIVPAHAAFGVLNIIKEIYFKYFKYVSDLLPIYTVNCFFKHKYPYYVVDDFQRKILNTFKFNKEVKGTLEDLGEKKFIYDNKRIICQYSKDVFETAKGEKSYTNRRFEEVKDGKIVCMPSYMINVFVDSLAKKNDYNQKSITYLGKFKSSVYPTIYDVSEIKKVFNLFKKFQSNSQLNNFIELLFEKYPNEKDEISYGELFDEYIKMCLQGIKFKEKLKDEELDFMIKSIKNCLFFEAFEIYKFGVK